MHYLIVRKITSEEATNFFIWVINAQTDLRSNTNAITNCTFNFPVDANTQPQADAN